MLKRFRRSEKAQGMVEYGLILALVSVVAVGSVGGVGGKVSDTFDKVVDGTEMEGGVEIPETIKYAINFNVHYEKHRTSVDKYRINSGEWVDIPRDSSVMRVVKAEEGDILQFQLNSVTPQVKTLTVKDSNSLEIARLTFGPGSPEPQTTEPIELTSDINVEIRDLSVAWPN